MPKSSPSAAAVMEQAEPISRLAAAYRPADGGVGLDQVSHHAAGSQGAQNLLVGKTALLLHIQERCGQYTAAPQVGAVTMSPPSAFCSLTAKA
jgi:hypothetical protein